MYATDKTSDPSNCVGLLEALSGLDYLFYLYPIFLPMALKAAFNNRYKYIINIQTLQNQYGNMETIWGILIFNKDLWINQVLVITDQQLSFLFLTFPTLAWDASICHKDGQFLIFLNLLQIPSVQAWKSSKLWNARWWRRNILSLSSLEIILKCCWCSWYTGLLAFCVGWSSFLSPCISHLSSVNKCHNMFFS